MNSISPTYFLEPKHTLKEMDVSLSLGLSLLFMDATRMVWCLWLRVQLGFDGDDVEGVVVTEG